MQNLDKLNLGDSIPAIISAYNESRSISGLVRSIRAIEYDRKRISVVVIDDGSSDQTGAMAKESGADVIINLKQNLGKTSAFFYGLCFVARHFRSRSMLSFDGDLECVTERQVSLLLDPVMKGDRRMTIGSVQGISNTSFLSGQRGFRSASLMRLLSDPYISALSQSQRRLGYGLEVLLNFVVSGVPELSFPINPNWGIELVDTEIRGTEGFVPSKSKNKLRADLEIRRTREFISQVFYTSLTTLHENV